MFDRDDLRAAVSAEIIGADQAARLERWLVARKTGDANPADGERLRFITNLNDIFITIGILILMFGATGVIGMMVAPMAMSQPQLAVAVVTIPVGALAWLLAEYFCRRRRLLLPSMALVIQFSVMAATLAAALAAPNPQAMEGMNLFDVLPTLTNFGYLGLGAGAIAALVFYLRFRLPFALAVIAVSLSAMAYVWALSRGDAAVLFSGTVSLFVGLSCLAIGLWFDARDPDRVSRLSDNAFWLHLVAAPQIIWGIRGLLDSRGIDMEGITGASILIAVLLGVAFLSVAINRRALIVSAIVTFTVAVGVVVNELSGGNPGWVLTGTALIVGGGIVLLGGGWKTARRAVLKTLPRGGAFDRIFPPEAA